MLIWICLYYFDGVRICMDCCIIVIVFITNIYNLVCSGHGCRNMFKETELLLQVLIEQKDMGSVDGKFISKNIFFCPNLKCLLNPTDHTSERKYPTITSSSPIYFINYPLLNNYHLNKMGLIFFNYNLM